MKHILSNLAALHFKVSKVTLHRFADEIRNRSSVSDALVLGASIRATLEEYARFCQCGRELCPGVVSFPNASKGVNVNGYIVLGNFFLCIRRSAPIDLINECPSACSIVITRQKIPTDEIYRFGSEVFHTRGLRLFRGIINLKPYPSLCAYLKSVSMSLNHFHYNIGRSKKSIGNWPYSRRAIVLYETLDGSFKSSQFRIKSLLP
jgi:hypothetical protein